MLWCVTNTLIPEARATLALAAARGLNARSAAHAMNLDPSTLSRKKGDARRWNRADSLAALAAFGDGVDELIADLEALRATRQYRAPSGAGTSATGQQS